MADQDTKRHWKDLEERDRPGEFEAKARDEFPAAVEAAPARLGRRGFLQAAGFSFGAALAGCTQAPVEKAIPYLVQPEEVTPGRALHYASTCAACPAACGLLVKNRDGRPVKLEGNPDHPLSRGALCAAGQASILGLYDRHRFKNPLQEGKETSWEEIDREVMTRLDALRERGGAVRLLTGTIHSPTVRAWTGRFLAQFEDAAHVVYDPLSASAILDAHERTHGTRRLPRYRFHRAEVIVSFDADFLGTWFSPVEHTRGYREARELEVLDPRKCLHVQFESHMSLTGTKADERVVVSPAELASAAAQVAEEVVRLAGERMPGGDSAPAVILAGKAAALARRLWEARGECLVVSGSQDVATQSLCNFMNHLLGAYGKTLDIAHPSEQRQGGDRGARRLLSELKQGKVAALLVAGVNPVYDLPDGRGWAEALQKTPLVVSFAERGDETAEHAHFVCPDHHYLESWGDAEPVRGLVSLQQPCIHPLGETRALVETLAAWSGDPKPAYELVREHWRTHIYPLRKDTAPFQDFWDRAVHDGVVELLPAPAAAYPFLRDAVRNPKEAAEPGPGEFTLVLYPTVGLRDGRHAYNPWLHELPDPVTKVTWDNYACLSPKAAETLGVRDGDVVRIEPSAGGEPLELPVLVQPGQHDRTAAIPLGYGGKLTERFAGLGPEWIERRPTVNAEGRVGRNAAPLLRFAEGRLRYGGRPVKLRPTGRREELASTQAHHHITVPEKLALPGGERRPAVREASFDEYVAANRGGEALFEAGRGDHADLWPGDHPYPERQWGMAIDLDACTGCSACVIACQAENNIPVVGKDEVRRQREMHWLRIDRYYSGEGAAVETAHQPMLCQHCGNAPCETVCPVLATVHSEEGLNQQVYNRCVGTRYCANNCPYKVRRFNWFDYARDDALENLTLNPDVTVRSRGVMEKCSFCVQRIQEAKIEARREGRELAPGAVQTACQQSCPANAIVFGDLKDGLSHVSRLARSSRRYQVLEEINVKPAVTYLGIVRRPQPEEAADG